MKKFIVFIIFIFSSLMMLGENGILTGRVLRYHQNQHTGIKIVLRGENEKIIDKKETIFTGDFFFDNISNGKYILEISDLDNYKKIIEIEKKSTNEDIGEVKIASEGFYGIYMFSNVILLITVLINVVIIYFMFRGKEVKGKKYAIYSIFGFNFWFVFEFIRFVIGTFNENLAANLWAVSNIGTAFVTIFLFMFFMNFPVKRMGNKVMILSKIIVAAIAFTLLAMLIWVFMPSSQRFDEAIRLKSNIFMLLFYMENLIFLILSVAILLYNMIKYKNKYEGEISRILFLRFSAVVFILIFSITILSLYSINEVFDGYYKTVFALMDIILYWGILKYGFSFRYMRKYRGLSDIFIEIFKYLMMMLIVFAAVNFININSKNHVPMYFGAFVFLKIVFDLYFRYKNKYEFISDEPIISKLESVESREDIEYVLARELKNRIGVEKCRIIYKNEFEEKNRAYFENINNESDIMEEIEEDIFNQDKYYNAGFKVRFNKEVIAVIFLSGANGKSYFTRKESDFLINLAENISHIINGVIMSEAKKRMMKKEKAKPDNECAKTRASMIYIKGYLDIIKNKTEDEEIKNYCDIISEKIENGVEENEGV